MLKEAPIEKNSHLKKILLPVTVQGHKNEVLWYGDETVSNQLFV